MSGGMICRISWKVQGGRRGSAQHRRSQAKATEPGPPEPIPRNYHDLRSRPTISHQVHRKFTAMKVRRHPAREPGGCLTNARFLLKDESVLGASKARVPLEIKSI